MQLLFTEEEFKQLQVEALKVGLTVPLYIKGEVLKNDEFVVCYKKLIEKADELPSGTKFSIKTLFGVEWTMRKGVKLNLGRTFYNRVKGGVVKNILELGKDSSNVMWYEKKKEDLL